MLHVQIGLDKHLLESNVMQALRAYPSKAEKAMLLDNVPKINLAVPG